MLGSQCYFANLKPKLARSTFVTAQMSRRMRGGQIKSDFFLWQSKLTRERFLITQTDVGARERSRENKDVSRNLWKQIHIRQTRHRLRGRLSIEL